MLYSIFSNLFRKKAKKYAVPKVGADQITLVSTSCKVGVTRSTGPIGWLRLCMQVFAHVAQLDDQLKTLLVWCNKDIEDAIMITASPYGLC